MEQAQVQTLPVRPLQEIIAEVVSAIEQARASNPPKDQKIKDLRWQFDQVSAKMNQAIYNDQAEQIHKTCLETVTVLVEMLARS